MRRRWSLRARLMLGAALMLVVFLLGAGWAVQRAHEESVRAARFARLQATVYLLLAAAEIDAVGALVMPAEFPEPRLSLPGSGLYASIVNVARRQTWRSGSMVGVEAPQPGQIGTGEWRQEVAAAAGHDYLAVSTGVSWTGSAGAVPLVLTVFEDKAEFDREIDVFERTSWAWLGGSALLLLLSQTVLLRWGLAPLRQATREIRAIEHGDQATVEGHYPMEVAALTDNLNTLIAQERQRQTRYREALSFLAHSLKTPLAVLRTALSDPAQLPAAVATQVARMDDIVQHQLSRAAASGASRFVPALAFAPVMERIRDSLAKVYADKGLVFTLDCEPALTWRIDEGDTFELLGNLMDNAAKWARQQVAVSARREGDRLLLRIDDDGPGFGDTRAILQLHVRGDERVPGHGVGLAVVNDLVASHGGELALLRSDLGGGRVEIVLRTA